MLGADLYAQSVLTNEILASEFSRKFIKSALLVGIALSSCIMHKEGTRRVTRCLETVLALCRMHPNKVSVLCTVCWLGCTTTSSKQDTADFHYYGCEQIEKKNISSCLSKVHVSN